MQKELLDQWGDFTKSAFDSLKELGDINTRLVTRLSRQQLEILNTSLEAASRETQLVSESKGYKELLSGQSSLAAQYNRKLLDIVQETTDILEESKGELTTWAEKGMKNVEKGVTKAQKNVADGLEQTQQGMAEATDGAKRATRRATNAAKRATRHATNGAKRATRRGARTSA